MPIDRKPHSNLSLSRFPSLEVAPRAQHISWISASPPKKGKKISTDIRGYPEIPICYYISMSLAYKDTIVHWSKSQQAISRCSRL